MTVEQDDVLVALATSEKLETGDVILTNNDVTKYNEVTKMETSFLRPKVTTYMVLKTISLILSFLVMGLFLEIVGPTLPDIMLRVRADFEEISRALVAHSIGYFISSVPGGILTDRFSGHIELFLSIAFLAAGIGTILVPWVTKLQVLALLLLLRGLSHGCIDTFCNFLCMKIWQSKASSPVHALHFGFGIGAFIIPQIVRPFLAKNYVHYNETLHGFVDNRGVFEVDIVKNSTANMSELMDLRYIAHYNTTGNTYSKIEIPYSICGLLAVVFSIFYIIFYCYERRCCQEKKPISVSTVLKKQEKHSLKSMLSPGSCSDGHPCFAVKLFILMFIYEFNVVGCENTVGRFLYSFATEGELAFSTDEAANLNSLFWICFTCGRGVTMLIAKWVPQHVMLIVEACLNLICGIVLAAWGYNTAIVIWIFVGLLGMSLSPCVPSALAWINQYLVMHGISFAIFFSGGASGGMFFQWFTGFMFQYYGPHTWLYIILAYSLILALSITLMQLVVCKKKVRFDSDVIVDVSVTNDEEEKAVKS